VESVQLKCTGRSAAAFKQEVADLAMALTVTIESSTYTESVEAFKDRDSQGWTIEVTPKEELETCKDHLMAMAKNALFDATSKSSTAYIMGYAAKPFISKSSGSVAVVGDMRDESRACWDFYSKGMCTRGCQCRWEHPECLTPINVVFKERSSLICTTPVLHCSVGSGGITAPR
jgi:hypothetical protein